MKIRGVRYENVPEKEDDSCLGCAFSCREKCGAYEAYRYCAEGMILRRVKEVKYRCVECGSGRLVVMVDYDLNKRKPRGKIELSECECLRCGYTGKPKTKKI
jgi:hypothetical protein